MLRASSIPRTWDDPVPQWRDHVPRVLPSGWREVQTGPDGAVFLNRQSGLVVILSLSLESDLEWWLHVSLSRADRIPSYEDIAGVKDVFIGTDRYAYQVFPPRTKHVNIHPYCLHLWSCLGGPVTPDFTRGGKTL